MNKTSPKLQYHPHKEKVYSAKNHGQKNKIFQLKNQSKSMDLKDGPLQLNLFLEDQENNVDNVGIII